VEHRRKNPTTLANLVELVLEQIPKFHDGCPRHVLPPSTSQHGRDLWEPNLAALTCCHAASSLRILSSAELCIQLQLLALGRFSQALAGGVPQAAMPASHRIASSNFKVLPVADPPPSRKAPIRLAV